MRGTAIKMPKKEIKVKDESIETVAQAHRALERVSKDPSKQEAIRKEVSEKFPDILIERRRI